ncbi:hypothetical protein V1478_001583 [Vespula squamosa]|uniref:Uncharacterized protein n=1 Tax=Vespula squamosa TaxID=30214 RepID=A0ABD2C1V1_VESSQ
MYLQETEGWLLEEYQNKKYLESCYLNILFSRARRKRFSSSMGVHESFTMPTTTTDERSFVRFVLRRASFCDAFVIRNNFDGGGGKEGGGGEEEEEEEEEEGGGNRSKGNSFRFSTKFFELPFENSRCESYTVFVRNAEFAPYKSTKNYICNVKVIR